MSTERIALYLSIGVGVITLYWFYTHWKTNTNTVVTQQAGLPVAG